MQTPASSNAILVPRFRQFHRELLAALSRLEEEETLAAVGAAPANGKISSEELSSRLITFLDVQSVPFHLAQARERQDLYREAQYVMVSLADELVLSSNWKGKSHWVLLESRLFGSHSSGEAFFERLDKLLLQPVGPDHELEQIYFYALSLGFQGKYRGQNDRGRLALYRKRLYERIYESPVRDLVAMPVEPVFSQAYDYTLQNRKARRLPSARIWVLCLITIISLWIAASDALWRYATAPLMGHIQEIKRNADLLDNTTNTVQKTASTSGEQKP